MVENNKAGLGILSLQASDVDDNTTLHYWLDDEDSFVIDDKEILKPIYSFDREVQENYNLTVYVKDSLNAPSHTASTFVHVKVLDENDEKPIFSSTKYHFAVFENFSPFVLKPSFQYHPVTVGKIEATDADLEPFNKFTFKILEDKNGTASLFPSQHHFSIETRTNFYRGRIPFAINSTTGVITCSSLLDREAQAFYSFKVVAIDYFLPQTLQSTCDVVVEILDLNDEAPIFLEPKNPYLLEGEPSDHTSSVNSLYGHECDVKNNSYIIDQIKENNTNRNIFYNINHAEGKDAFIKHRLTNVEVSLKFLSRVNHLIPYS